MARSFSRKLSNSSPVQKKNGLKTWTGELLDTLLESGGCAFLDILGRVENFKFFFLNFLFWFRAID